MAFSCKEALTYMLRCLVIEIRREHRRCLIYVTLTAEIKDAAICKHMLIHVHPLLKLLHKQSCTSLIQNGACNAYSKIHEFPVGFPHNGHGFIRLG